MRRQTARGIVRHLGETDPRSLKHPCHREQVLELARALGRDFARREFAFALAALKEQQPPKLPQQTSIFDLLPDPQNAGGQ
jgi:hypothetical protein